jgi:membrane protein implicated in regulation of membrane protease activity
MKQLNRFAISGIATGLLLLCIASADAYIGPGAGLSLFGALWALIAAVAAALAFLVLWPIRKAMRRRTAQKKAAAAVSQSATADHAAGRTTVPDAMHDTPETLTR